MHNKKNSPVLNNRSRQKGLSILELMISSAIGIVVLVGVLTVYESAKKSYKVSDTISRKHDYARFTFNRLAKELRMVGSLGCAGDPSGINNVLNNNTDFAYDFTSPIQGSEGEMSGWDPVLPTEVTGVKAGTDVFSIRTIYGQAKKIMDHGTNATGSGDLVIMNTATSPQRFSEGDIVLASDCQRSSIFQVTGLTTNATYTDRVNLQHAITTAHTPGNASTALGFKLDLGEVIRIRTVSYYVKEQSGALPALYRQVGDSTPEMLVDGVENLQILYGVDGDSSDNISAATEYVPADEVSDWSQVLAARLSMLMVSENSQFTNGNQTIDFNGDAVTNSDRHLRSVFDTTVSFRSRSG